MIPFSLFKIMGIIMSYLKMVTSLWISKKISMMIMVMN